MSASSRRVLVLCFDGTGQTFHGDGTDSNIIKIFKTLDGEDNNIFRYYQPGIGTYIEDSALSKTSKLAKISSAVQKTKDMMYGTTFDEHIRGGYQFLMQNYVEGADIYIFGFSRGAYTARFLAHMLDGVGLLSVGNEEMFRFAWKAFSQWQQRSEGNEKEKEKKKKLFNFMKAFRETFGRPIRRIRFLGLFDTVNSVPRFESKWMSRTKFPYVAKSSAKVVRHAVSIDERRAKFRQNLIGQQRPNQHHHHHDGTHHLQSMIGHLEQGLSRRDRDRPKAPTSEKTVSESSQHEPVKGLDQHAEKETNGTAGKKPRLEKRQTFGRFKPRHKPGALAPLTRTPSATSLNSAVVDDQSDIDQDESEPQDIQEVWFPGCHSDIGGGWPLEEGEEVSLAFPPLIWMLREARKAGLPMDDEALAAQGFYLEEDNEWTPVHINADNPVIEVDGQVVPASPELSRTQDPMRTAARDKFLHDLELAATAGVSHDALLLKQGTPFGGVCFWTFMEYLPFRRMDLRPDGTWAPIRWPLPCGETRDIPNDAWISHTAIRRMQANPKYRPGNLIIGGGGRGVRIAPKKAGTGNWTVHREQGNPVGEVYIRDMSAVKQQ